MAGLGSIVLLSGAPAAAASGAGTYRGWPTAHPIGGTTGVNYNGGPVSHSMKGVVVDWGPSVGPAYTNETTGDPGLIKYLASASGSTGDIGGVLAQYMDFTGHNAANASSYGNQYVITPSVTDTTITDSRIQTELVDQIQAGNLPRPSGDGLQTTYLVLFPSGDTECLDQAQQQCSGTYFCAYHSSTALADGTNVLYAVLPDNSSGAMSQGCGSAPSLLDDQTSYLSHEWSETITDPLGTAWWNNNRRSATYGNEIGDNCNGRAAQNGSWWVQLEWSNLDRNCVSAESAYLAPTASFLAPSTAGVGQAANFDASSASDPAGDNAFASYGAASYSITSGIASYQWNWGDGTASASGATATATHSYASTGNYQVSLTVTDRLGFTSTVTRQIAVTSSPTATPQAATGAASSVSDTGATLAGTINPEGQAVQYQFAYGTSASALTQTTPVTAGPAGSTASPVLATVSGLTPATTYYFQLEVIAGGQTYSGSVQSFATSASTPPASQTPVPATGAAAQITGRSARLTGTIDPGGPQAVRYHFAYGTSAGALNSATRSFAGPSGTTSVPVSVTLDGLGPHTTYYFQLVVTLGGQSYAGALSNFTTLTPAPGAVTGPPLRVTSAGATVAGFIYPNGSPTTYLVEFGTTTAYGHSTPPLTEAAASPGGLVLVSLSGLAPRTVYHYRIVATSSGGTATGADRAFTTSRAPGAPPRLTFHLHARARLTAARAGRLKVSFSCNTTCDARFSVTVAGAGLARFAPVAVTLAHGSGHARANGSGTATIAFAPAIRAQLARYRNVKLLVLGYATSTRGAPSPPLTAGLTLT